MSKSVIDLLANLATAIELSDLTDRQRECLRLVYNEGLDEKEVARVLGIARNTVNVYLNTACSKIAEIYESWAWRGEGYDFTEGVVL